MNKRECIEAAIANMIAEHIVEVGKCVPSIRRMSKLYSFSATPVIEAYKDLERLGILEGRPKSSFVVVSDDLSRLPAELRPAERPESAAPEPQGTDEPMNNPFRYDDSAADCSYDFRRVSIAPLVPSEEMALYISRNLKLYPDMISISPRGCDDPLLVDGISRYMLSCKCIISKKEICITNNSLAMPLILSLQACGCRNRSVILTAPCAKSHIYAASMLGCKIIYIRSTVDGGIDLDSLERALQQNPDVAALLISPNYQAPSGVQMSDAAKQRMLEMCACSDIAIIEDDSNGDLYFKGKRPQPVKSLAPGRTVYISSFSNTLAPGLQIHWVCPGRYLERFRRFRDDIQATPPVFLQNGFGIYLQSKQFHKHLDYVRSTLSSAVSLTRDTVYNTFPPKTHVSNPGGGYNIWVCLPPEADVQSFRDAALEHDIYVPLGSEFGVDDSCFTINCSIIARSPKKLEGIKLLGALASKLAEKGGVSYV